MTLTDTVTSSVWDAPTPCPSWTARQLAGHIIGAAQQTQALLLGEVPPAPVTEPSDLGDVAGDHPAAGVRAAVVPLLVAVTGLDTAAMVGTPHGALPVEQVLAMALVEPVIHGWDLAVAAGQPWHLDDDSVRILLTGVEQMGGQLAATGMYAPAVPVPATADPAQRLLAALGRGS